MSEELLENQPSEGQEQQVPAESGEAETVAEVAAEVEAEQSGEEEVAEEQVSNEEPVEEEPTEPAAPADPFQRLQKKKVAKPKALGSANKQVKKGRKISPRIFLAGCAFFFMIFLALIFVGLYYALTSTDYLQSLGLEIDVVKNILIIFASLFFGIIFFVGFYILVLNVYRAATVKGKKLKFILGIVLGFLVIALTVVFGTLAITKIQSISGSSKIQTNQLALPYIETRDDSLVWVNEGIPVIAPLNMKYQLNKEQFDRNILPKLGTNQIDGFILDCGNGYSLEGTRGMYLNTNGYFPEHCLYLEKGVYPVTLTVNYYNRQVREQQSQTFKLYDLEIGAGIQIEAIDDEPSVNDKGTEQIIGIAPVDTQFRAQLLFTDLGLGEDRIVWDLDGDGQGDIENNASFGYTFDEPKLHTVHFRLPGLASKFANTWYKFELRVVESELAKCDIKIEQVKDKTYKFTPQFDEQVSISQYKYIITDTQLDTQVEKIDTNKDSTNFTFPNGGNYEVSMMYFTPQKQKGSCNSAPLTVGFDGNQVEFDLRFRQDSSVPFAAVNDDTAVTRDMVGNAINVSILPAVLELSITDIFPDPTADLAVYYDGKQIFEERDDVYEVNIGTLGQKQLEFVITTAEGKESQQNYQVNVSRGSVVAALKADPVVGEDPLTVSLDASISALYDEDDEIVYFNWDFDDGTTMQNVSQGKVDHVYRYDNENERGDYYPTVTVKTRKGFEDTIRLKEPIVVKKQQREAVIRADSHPTQQARVGEIVNYSLETDGVVKRIDWNFGNLKTVGCDDRSCTAVSVVYDEAGEYEVKAEVQYDNDTPVVARMRLRVFE